MIASSHQVQKDFEPTILMPEKSSARWNLRTALFCTCFIRNSLKIFAKHLQSFKTD